MGLHVRESGPAGASTVVLLHGAERSGRSWDPVVRHLRQYRCLLPDLPAHGESSRATPFGIGRAAAAVADLIRADAGTGRVHLVGHSLGAQVGVQLLANEPELVDRAVLCGAIVNPLPGVWLTRRLLGAFAAVSRSIELSQTPEDEASPDGAPSTEIDDAGGEVTLMAAEQLSEIVTASAGFTLPDNLELSPSVTLFISGGLESPLVHQSAAALGQRMPNGLDGVAHGMGHNWPLQYPAVFARTVSSWLSHSALPSQIILPDPDRR
jgi:pimeloyl-ACP methyl ester carboxylesterase